VVGNPSPSVVRSIIGTHAPLLLEVMDALKAKFNAKLVHLSVPKADLEIGQKDRYGEDAIERSFRPWIPEVDTVAEAREYAEQKARSRAQTAEFKRQSTRARTPRRIAGKPK
jgi:hypothetical protein